MEIHKITSFDFIRYSTCWEDANVLCKALDVKKNDKVLSVCSGGDNSFSLLTNEPSLVVAVDINKTQLYLAELKKVAIRNLSQQATIEFLGYRSSIYRLQIYQRIKSNLSSEAFHYWENHLGVIESGIVHSGKFERYIRSFAKYIIPLIHNKKTIDKMFEAKSVEDQKEFYNKEWNTWRWRFFFKLFFSKWVLGKFGRDPEFMKQVEIPVSDFILQQAQAHLNQKEAQNNIFLHYCLTGNFGLHLPNYLLQENFQLVKQNIDRLVFFHGYAQDAFDRYGAFDKINLSNIFEYMDDTTFVKVAESVVNHTSCFGKIAYWNLMVTRNISELFPRHCKTMRIPDVVDRGFFYKDFIVNNF